jgi:hypothetical protein
MNSEKWDKGVVGFACASVFTVGLYFILAIYARKLLEHYDKAFILFYPKAELFILVIDVVLFRVFMINLQKQQFGKGWLIVVFIFALWFFYNHYHRTTSGLSIEA